MGGAGHAWRHQTLHPQWDKRVTNQLTGTVVGHVTTPIDPEHFDSAPLELGFGPQQVGSLTPATESVGVRVLKQQEGGRILTGGDLAGKLGLQIPGLLVGQQAEAADVADLHMASITSGMFTPSGDQEERERKKRVDITVLKIKDNYDKIYLQTSTNCVQRVVINALIPYILY